MKKLKWNLKEREKAKEEEKLGKRNNFFDS